MRRITIFFHNGVAFVVSSCYSISLGTYSYWCNHCTVSQSSLRRILSLYPKYDVDFKKLETELMVSVHSKKGW
jgi:hypothetical protein